MKRMGRAGPAVPSPVQAAADPNGVNTGRGHTRASRLAGEGASSLPHPSIVIPDHVLLRRVGRGAYGEVWLARSALGTFRAVKVVRLSELGDLRPSEREYHGIQRYEPVSRGHPGLIDILQVGRNEAAGYFYYVMELADPCVDTANVFPDPAYTPANPPDTRTPATPAAPAIREGPVTAPSTIEAYAPRTLREELVRRGRLPVDECVQLGLDLASALAHLHAAGLVHRDVKPSNLVFVEGRLKLADIGLITSIGDAQSVVGTDGYLPPEGAGTPPADLYSLGKVLYEMSTGLDRRQFPVLPAEMGDVGEALRLRELNEVVVRACAPDPFCRYPTASAMIHDLDRIQRGKSVLRRRGWEAAARQARRLAPVVAMLVVAVAGTLLLRSHHTPPAATSGMAASAMSTERGSVFVLPFRYARHPWPDDPSLSLPMFDIFIEGLASLNGVRRSPRRSGWDSRDESELLASLARTNDFRHVLSGRLEAPGGTVTLHLRLYDRASGHQVWGGTFTNGNVVALARSALDGLLGCLGVGLSEAESQALDGLLRTKAEAARLVTEGWRLYSRSFLVHTGVTEIITFSEKARRIDPQSIDARSLRGCMLRDLALFSRSPLDAWPDAEREFSAILEIDPTDRAALNQRAGAWVVRDWDWAWLDAHVQEELRWADESYRDLLRALWLRIHGEMEDSKRLQAMAEADHPRDLASLLHGGYARWTWRDYDDGLRLAREAAQLNPHAVWPDFLHALLAAEKGDGDEALRAIERVEQQTQLQFVTALKGYAYARMGQPGRAREVLESLFAARLQQPYVQPYPIARVYAALGDQEKALDWLERAEADRSEFLVITDAGGLRTDPAWDGLREHPRFQALLRKVGLDVWPVPIQARRLDFPD